MDRFGGFRGSRTDLVELLTRILFGDPAWQRVDDPPADLAYGAGSTIRLVLAEMDAPPTVEALGELVTRVERVREAAQARWPDHTIVVSAAIPAILPAEVYAEWPNTIGLYDGKWLLHIVRGSRLEGLNRLFDEADLRPGPEPEWDGPWPFADGTASVHYGQISLTDGGMEDDARIEDLRATPVGVIGVRPGAALMLTGLHTGIVGFVVAVHDHDPGAELDAYEDVVEIDFVSRDGAAALVTWAGECWLELPPLPAGPGTYRLRYHGRNVDAGRAADTASEPVDEYLLQIWPAAPSPAVILKRTSTYYEYWRQPRLP